MKTLREPLFVVTHRGHPLKDSYGGIYLCRTKKEALNLAANKRLADMSKTYDVTKAYIAFDPT